MIFDLGTKKNDIPLFYLSSNWSSLKLNNQPSWVEVSETNEKFKSNVTSTFYQQNVFGCCVPTKLPMPSWKTGGRRYRSPTPTQHK